MDSPPDRPDVLNSLAALVRLSTGRCETREVIGAVLESCQRLTGASGLLLYSPAEGSRRLVLATQRGVPPDIAALAAEATLGAGVTGAAAKGAAVAFKSIADYPESALRAALLEHGYAASGAVRLHASGELVGVLAMLFETAAPTAERALLETLGGVLGMVIGRDRLQRALSAEAQRYSAIVESFPLPLWILRDGIFEYTNPALCAFLQRTPDDLVGRSILDPEIVLEEDHPVVRARYAERMQGTGTHGMYEIRVRRADGAIRDVGVFGVVVVDQRGPTMIGLAIDRTEHNALLRNTARSQKLHTLGTLSGGIAHDFNNLLGTIEGYASLLLEEPSLAERVRQRLQLVSEAAQRGSRLTRRLLNFAQARHPEVRAVPIASLIDGALALARPHYHGAYRFAVDDGPPNLYVTGDEAQLQQVLLNLLINARDAMPDGGELSVSVRPLQVTPSAPVGDLALGDYVAIDVADTGLGIPADALGNVFEPFWTTKGLGAGSGLGLAMAHAIVTAHRGWIDVDSTVGEGTRFTIVVPRSGAPDPETERPDETYEPSEPEPTDPGDAPRRVLAIDDEAGIRAFLAEALEALGYEHRVVGSAEEALAFLDGGEGEHWPALVMMDISVPGEDPIETLRALRERLPAVPVLVSSGFARADTADALIAEGADAFLPKPYRVRKLRGVLDELMG